MASALSTVGICRIRKGMMPSTPFSSIRSCEPCQIPASTCETGAAIVSMRIMDEKRSGARRNISNTIGPPMNRPPTAACRMPSLSSTAMASLAYRSTVPGFCVAFDLL